jgi:hypothetical protein
MAFFLVFVFILTISVGTIATRRRLLPPQQQSTPSLRADDGDVRVPNLSQNDGENSEASTWEPKIEPLDDFDWKATPPMKLRPFRPTYHITMGVL